MRKFLISISFLLLLSLVTILLQPWRLSLASSASSLLQLPYTAPQGRLTLASGAPVMAADETAQTSVYYTPYVGNLVPVESSTGVNVYTFSQLTMALSASYQTSGNLYDLFLFLNSGTVTIGAGPAWTSSTLRGTGTGTTEIQQANGLWVNANNITLENGSSTYTGIPTGQATYVGTVYMTANGQTGVQFKPAAASGGSNNIIGLYNAYNRVSFESLERDSTASWTYTSPTWRPANNSTSNRISYVDGLQQSQIWSSYNVICAGGGQSIIGINLNATSGVPSALTETQSGTQISLDAQNSFPPQLGLNYVQAMEANNVGSSTIFGGNGQYQYLILSGEY